MLFVNCSDESVIVIHNKSKHLISNFIISSDFGEYYRNNIPIDSSVNFKFITNSKNIKSDGIFKISYYINNIKKNQTFGYYSKGILTFKKLNIYLSKDTIKVEK